MNKPKLVTSSDYQASPVPDERPLGGERFENVGALSGGGGDDGLNDLRIRVSNLEVHAEYIRADIREMKPVLQDVRSRLDRLEIKVDHLPSKEYIRTAVVAGLGVVTLLVVFQAQIQHYLGTAFTP